MLNIYSKQYCFWWGFSDVVQIVRNPSRNVIMKATKVNDSTYNKPDLI